MFDELQVEEEFGSVIDAMAESNMDEQTSFRTSRQASRAIISSRFAQYQEDCESSLFDDYE